MATTAMQRSGGGGYAQRSSSSGLYDVLDLLLDKGLVVDVFLRVSLVGIELLTVDARIVIASVDTYLRFAEAVNRLDLGESSDEGLPQFVEEATSDGAEGKTNGIVEGSGDPPSGQGIAGAPLHLIAAEGAAALVSDIPSAEHLQLGRVELTVHRRVLDEALKRGTVLPMRFGVVLDGPDAVRRDLLEDHGEELRGQLAEMGGKVEVRVRAVYEEATLMQEGVRESPEIAQLQERIR